MNGSNDVYTRRRCELNENLRYFKKWHCCFYCSSKGRLRARAQQFVQVKRADEEKCTNGVSANWPRPVPPPRVYRSQGIITSRWAITSLLILAVTSEVSPKAGWPNGTLDHPRHPPVSPTQQTVIDFCKLSYYHDDSLLFCCPIYLSSSCNYRARLWF